jgi:hypothetical protein
MMNKMRVLFLLCTLCVPMISATTISVPVGDSYVQEFAQRYRSNHVEYKSDEDKLILYANPTTLRVVLEALGTLGVTGLGGACMILAGQAAPGSSDGPFMMCGGGIVLALGAYLGYKTIKDIKVKIDKVPYIILDAYTFICGDSSCSWKDVDHIEIETEQKTSSNTYHISKHFSTTQGTTITVRSLVLMDRYNSRLCSISEEDYYLPISFNQLRALITHYVTVYSKRT